MAIDSRANFRVDGEVWAEFRRSCEAASVSPSLLLQSFVRAYAGESAAVIGRLLVDLVAREYDHDREC